MATAIRFTALTVVLPYGVFESGSRWEFPDDVADELLFYGHADLDDGPEPMSSVDPNLPATPEFLPQKDALRAATEVIAE